MEIFKSLSLGRVRNGDLISFKLLVNNLLKSHVPNERILIESILDATK